jgi:hypothetical protein
MNLMPPLAAVAATLAVAASPSVAAASTPEPAFVHTGGGWDPFVVQAAGKAPVKAVVVLIGANNYG